MKRLKKDDLTQIDRGYFENLANEALIDLACRLRDFSVDLLERLEQNSKNSSRHPSSDSPYDKGTGKESESEGKDKDACSEDEDNPSEDKEHSGSDDSMQSNDVKRPPGKQPGAQGFWRSDPPVPEQIVPHYPTVCTGCGSSALKRSERPYMGFYAYELEKTDMGIRIRCTLDHYYGAVCECGDETKARPGEGVVSKLEGRKKDLKLTEYSMVGPMLVSFLSALSVRHKMSRVKIREFLSYWLGLELSVETIDKSIREACVACFPVVEALLEELQK
ncbi:DUF6444 domain-containing protein [Desulfobacter postgatei]|uniref:DUF6444 domain-containing protein n=1 Tax=Desulfobacter postgatei TaxID=2293 RepID=UPI00259B06D6|nr:DUF6444 domain-containing protein [uncultured Desulfobacter sp.]